MRSTIRVISLIFSALITLSIASDVNNTDQNNTPNRVDGDVDAFTGQIWAVLVAGSNTYDNYRHQADVCHAYQLLRRHGIPAERIITMMYDDIANNTRNPTKGVIINHPGGKDVYQGVVKDYVGKDVSTFLLTPVS